MKNKILKTMGTKRFSYALLTSALLQMSAFGIAGLCLWLIPWRWLEITTWFIVYFALLGYVVFNWGKWYDRYFK